MHAKDLWSILVWHLVDVKSDLRDLVVNRHIVGTVLAELVIRQMHYVVILEDVEDVKEQDSIEIVRHISPIVDTSSHELERVPGDLVILNKEVFEHRDRCNQVGIAKLIHNVPA